MEFQTKIHSSPKTETVINISGIKEIEELIPSDEDIVQWEVDQLEQIENNQEFDPIHIKIKFEDFVTILKKLYKKIGKELYFQHKDEYNFLITLSKEKETVFEKEIKQINLYSKQYRLPMVIIET
jgi:hypothetical protein